MQRHKQTHVSDALGILIFLVHKDDKLLWIPFPFSRANKLLNQHETRVLTWWCLGFCWVVNRWGNLFFGIAAGCQEVTWPTKWKMRFYPHGWCCWVAGSLVVPTAASWMWYENIKEGNLGLVLCWIFFFLKCWMIYLELFSQSTFLILQATVEGRHYYIVIFFSFSIWKYTFFKCKCK